MDLAAATVAERLRDGATQTAALEALEDHAAPIPTAVAIAAAPALVDVVSGATEHAALDRSVLLLARLLVEAAPEPAPIWGAACQGERLAALWAPALIVEATQRASTGGQPLTLEDARSLACIRAHEPPSIARGYTQPYAAVGRTVMESIGIVSTMLPRRSLLPQHCSTPSSCPAASLTRDWVVYW
jgi:hypothetical protein